MVYRQRHPGAVRKTLARMLESALLDQPGVRTVRVDPTRLHSSQGYYRASGHDFYRWEGTALVNGVSLSLDSYTTMTQIVRSRGVTLVRDGYSYDVYDATGN